MDVILVPGYWLDSSSWDEVVPVLDAAGFTTHALTLPGLEARDADRSGVTLADQVTAVVAAIDAATGPVALVGHSGGGPIAYAAADARVDRIASIVFIDSFPVPDGEAVGEDYPVDGDSVPFPDWSHHDQEDIADLDPAQREQLRARAIPEPAAVTHTPHALHDERRRELPVTIVATSRSSGEYRQWHEHPMFAEVAALTHLDYVDLPGSSHWPQLTQPQALGELLVTQLR